MKRSCCKVLSGRCIGAILLGIATNAAIVVLAASNQQTDNEIGFWFDDGEFTQPGIWCTTSESWDRGLAIEIECYWSVTTTRRGVRLFPASDYVKIRKDGEVSATDPEVIDVETFTIAAMDDSAVYSRTLFPWGEARQWPQLNERYTDVWAHAGVATFGVPLRCAWTEREVHDCIILPSTIDVQVWNNGVLSIPDHWSVLPTIANSLVLALAWRGLFALPFAARSLLRRFTRRGCCIHCGYSRAGVDAAAPCPECGSSFRPSVDSSFKG